jgi:hypothetical protein
VVARAAAARRGEAGVGQREAGKAAGKAQKGTWHEERRRGGGRCAAHCDTLGVKLSKPIGRMFGVD